MSVVSIKKKYWQHNFHAKVINYCLWIVLNKKFVSLEA